MQQERPLQYTVLLKKMSQVESANNMDATYLDTVSASKGSAWLIRIPVNGEGDISFKMETGAEVTAISVNTHKQLKEPKLTTANKILYGPSRTKLTVIGMFDATFSRGNTAIKQS